MENEQKCVKGSVARAREMVAELKRRKIHPYELSKKGHQYKRAKETEAKWEAWIVDVFESKISSVPSWSETKGEVQNPAEMTKFCFLVLDDLVSRFTEQEISDTIHQLDHLSKRLPNTVELYWRINS